MRRDGCTYVPLAARLADFGDAHRRAGSAARAMGRLLRKNAQEEHTPPSSPLARALQPAQEHAAEACSQAASSDPLPTTGSTPQDAAAAAAEALVPDLEVRLAAAREEGFAAGVEEGMARARAEAEARIAALEQAHAEALATRERLWADRLAADLANRLQEGFRHLARQLEAAVADILAPLVQEAMREQALADLAATIATLAEEGVRMQVKGPSSLIEALKARLPACPFEAQVDEALADIRVHLADAVIETRLGEWQARLAEAVAAADPAASIQTGTTVDSSKTDGEPTS